MKNSAALCLLIATMLCGSAAAADDGAWYVTQDVATRTCYRTQAPASSDTQRTLGAFNTFREAGQWTWTHRDVCAQSAVFS